MQLKRLSLTHYRNIEKKTFYFSPFLTLVVGPNSVGKTNLLESIYLMLSGHGIKEERQEELITIDKPHVIIEGHFSDSDDVLKSKIIIEKKDSVIKKFFINTIERRYLEFSKYLPPVVLFTPQLIESLTTEPSRRRGLFDNMLAVVDPEYKKRLTNYSSALTKRNKLLERPTQMNILINELSFWNKYLLEQAEYLTNKRDELARYFNEEKDMGDFSFELKYVANPLTLEKLEGTLDEQLRRKTTFFGPQRDDYEIYIDLNNSKGKFNIENYGSRSQQRLGLLWVILNQLRLFKKRLERLPILLLDDIFSELDETNSHLVVNVILRYQTIITTNNIELAEHLKQHKTIITL